MTKGISRECGSNGSQNHDTSKFQRRKDLKCYDYGMRGHLKDECWNNKKKGENTFESSTSQGCVAITLDDSEITYSEATTSYKGKTRFNNVWIMDLGGLWHMTPHRDQSYYYEPISDELV